MSRRQELLLGVAFLAGGLTLIFLVIPAEVRELTSQAGEVSPAFFPRILGWCLVALGIAHLASHLVRHIPAGGEEGLQGAAAIARGCGLIAIAAAYVWLLPRLGFLAATAVALVCMILFLGPWKPIRAVVVGVPFAWLLHLAFSHLLNVPLPRAGWLE